jgi:hypothetical protein
VICFDYGGQEFVPMNMILLRLPFALLFFAIGCGDILQGIKIYRNKAYHYNVYIKILTFTTTPIDRSGKPAPIYGVFTFIGGAIGMMMSVRFLVGDFPDILGFLFLLLLTRGIPQQIGFAISEFLFERAETKNIQR